MPDESPSNSPVSLPAMREIDSSSLYTTIIEYQAGELLTAEAYDNTEGDDAPAMTDEEMVRVAANIGIGHVEHGEAQPRQSLPIQGVR